MKKIIFDLDLTLVDTSVLGPARKTRNWPLVYSMIPQCRVYNGVEEVFRFIEDNRLLTTVVSTAPRSYVCRVLDYFNLHVDHVIGYHDTVRIKPDPEPMLKALSLMKTRAADTISLGDRSIDIASSRSAGIQSVACLWGTKERELLLSSSPDVIISSPIEMISLIK